MPKMTRLGFLAVSSLAAFLATGVLQAAATKPAQRTFPSAKAAIDALVAAAERFDVPALKAILGPDGVDLVVTGDSVQDRNQAAAFAANVHKKLLIVPDPVDPKRVTFVIGPDDWPAPIPVVEKNGKWRFDTASGRQEVLLRRIGQNELDAIRLLRSFVTAQHLYASVKREGSLVNQYAQRVISSPGRKDGLAWQNPDGTWGGPLGQEAARAIAEGYHDKTEPYHGYYFKVLKRQGPSAPLGELDFVIQGAMIGGFALLGAPADYEKTGVKTFMVSHDGVVYEADLGPGTVEVFRAMESFDPDERWSPVQEP